MPIWRYLVSLSFNFKMNVLACCSICQLADSVVSFLCFPLCFPLLTKIDSPGSGRAWPLPGFWFVTTHACSLLPLVSRYDTRQYNSAHLNSLFTFATFLSINTLGAGANTKLPLSAQWRRRVLATPAVLAAGPTTLRIHSHVLLVMNR